MAKRGTVIGAIAAFIVFAGVMHFQRSDSPSAPPEAAAIAATGDERPPIKAATAPAAANEKNVTPERAADSPPAGPQDSDSSHEPASGATALAPVMLSGDFPLYLTLVARPSPGKSPSGCKETGVLLAEMAEETRDELWADRIERDLREFIGRHPHGFHVSVGCRATICQVSVVGEDDAVREDSGRANTLFWYHFRQRLGASATGAELGRNAYFIGEFPTQPPQHISGIVLTSVGRDTSGEPAACTPSFGPLRGFDGSEMPEGER